MASTNKDTTFTKIFVGGLPYHTTDQSLREFFEQFGDIEEAVVITDRQTGKSRGYGFVTMADRPAAERACEEPNPIIDGRKANVNLAYLGAKPRTIQTAFPMPPKVDYPGLLHGQFGLPQYIYPGAYHLPASSASLAAPRVAMPLSAAHHPAQMSPSAVQQAYLDNYLSGYLGAGGQVPAAAEGLAAASYPAGLAGHVPAGYEAYLYAAAGYTMAPAAAAYQYAAAAPNQLSGVTLSEVAAASQNGRPA